MFETMTVGEILRDLRSIKVTPKTRDFIDRTRMYFESEGNIPADVKMKLRRIFKRYSQQVKELHAARARARRTNGLRSRGISMEEASRLVEARREHEAEMKRDVGF